MDQKNPESRGAKMLGMLGIRLQKETKNNTFWKVVPCSQETTNVGDETNNEEQETNNMEKETNSMEKETNSMEKETNSMEIETNVAENEMNNMEEEDEPFSSDDSIADPNYIRSTSSSSDEGGPDGNRVPLSTLQQNETEIERKKKTRKRKAAPFEWKRNKTKLLRNSGQAYTTLNKGEHVGARQIKMPCDNNCKQKCTTKFTEEERSALFKMYWDLGDIVKQRAFLSIMVQEINPKYTYPILINGKRKRTNNNAFYFEKDNKKIRVCKLFFVSTLGITSRCIRSFVEKRRAGDFEDKRGKHGNKIMCQKTLRMKYGRTLHLFLRSKATILELIAKKSILKEARLWWNYIETTNVPMNKKANLSQH